MEKLSKDQEEAVLRVFQASLTPLKFKEHLREKGLIEECFKSGWYNNRFGLAYFDDKKKGLYGFHNGEWGLKCMIYFCNKGLIKPIHLVIEAALIKEAKKRGFKEGVSYISIDCGIKATYTSVHSYSLQEDGDLIMYGEHFNNDNKSEYFNSEFNGGSIFSDGKWAEITEQKKTINVDGVIYKEV